MAWGSGTYTRVGGATHWVDDKNAAINIVASRHDTNDEDIATGINQCLTRDNQAKPTASFIANADNTYDLGSGAVRWRNSYSATFYASDGAVGTPSIAFNSATTTGFYRTTANQIAIALGGVTAGQIAQGTFTYTLTGGTTSPTGTATWQRIGNFVHLMFDGLSFTSNSTSFTATGLPAAIQPATSGAQSSPLTDATDNGVFAGNTEMSVNSGSGTMTFLRSGSATGWTNAGSKGIARCITYYYVG